MTKNFYSNEAKADQKVGVITADEPKLWQTPALENCGVGKNKIMVTM